MARPRTTNSIKVPPKGKLQKLGRESALNSNLVGKHILLAGRPQSSFTLEGQRFSGVIIGGCNHVSRGLEAFSLFYVFAICSCILAKCPVPKGVHKLQLGMKVHLSLIFNDHRINRIQTMAIDLQDEGRWNVGSISNQGEGDSDSSRKHFPLS